MGKKLKRALAASSALALSLGLVACGGDSGGGGSANNDPGVKGGTLNYLQSFLYESSDPQRIYYGVQLAQWRRTVYRGLVAFPMSEDPVEGTTPVADLATDTGTASEGGKVWKFTLKDGVKWEDGTDITCEDVQYGTSRVFANDVIIGGPNYTLSYIDVKDYPGPYKATPAQQAAFEKAVSCDGKTVTFHFNKPWADFNQAAAGMMMVDPYKKSFDQGDRSKWKVLSNGPYKVEGGNWDKNKGATLVRNENYDPATDNPDQLRKALPDKINWVINGSDTAGELFNDRLIQDAGEDQYAITSARVTPQQLPKVTQEPVKSRYLNVVSPFTDYLVFNHKKLTDPKIREALAVSVNTEGYIKANGGDLVMEHADSIVNPGTAGYKANDAFKGVTDGSGDPEAAKALLKEAGVKMPYAIKLSYPKTPTADKSMAILQESWNKAGFKVTLDGQGDTYYDVIAQPDKDSDLMWAGWGSDWPSMMTVIPPLFDSRPNISKTTCGNDYGCYESDELNAIIDEAANAANVEDQQAKMQEADAFLGSEYAYIPLDNQKFNWLRGSKVTGFTTTPASSSYPELGLIGVSQK
ncbi:ABC transporter substrate-binding protein [Nocardioides jensenii]|uniref:ABC transporter substrate-binding protein n=1 Tax=Nocardioides jensenii TaxID=1843 RepID=UPI00082FDFA5|nr:ABC transporter substrate-binding protein [Nocardioides jensenii]